MKKKASSSSSKLCFSIRIFGFLFDKGVIFLLSPVTKSNFGQNRHCLFFKRKEAFRAAREDSISTGGHEKIWPWCVSPCGTTMGRRS